MYSANNFMRFEEPDFTQQLLERKMARERVIEERHKPVDEAIAYCREQPDQMTEREAMILRSMYWRRQVYEHISESQQAWLFRLQARIKEAPQGEHAQVEPTQRSRTSAGPAWCSLR